jgi:hypothetical protein
MQFTSERRLDDGVIERAFTLGEIVGVASGSRPDGHGTPVVVVLFGLLGRESDGLAGDQLAEAFGPDHREMCPHPVREGIGSKDSPALLAVPHKHAPAEHFR